MSKYRKRPVVIEAEQYVEDGKPVKGICVNPNCPVQHFFHVHTIHENQYVAIEVGDWIIPEPDGEHYYPCKPDIFAVTYEEVVEIHGG